MIQFFYLPINGLTNPDVFQPKNFLISWESSLKISAHQVQSFWRSQGTNKNKHTDSLTYCFYRVIYISLFIYFFSSSLSPPKLRSPHNNPLELKVKVTNILLFSVNFNPNNCNKSNNTLIFTSVFLRRKKEFMYSTT